MKLILDDMVRPFEILIHKYNVKQLKLKDSGIVAFGEDMSAAKVRSQPLPRSKFVKETQIARYGDILYIPADQLPLEEMDGLITFKYPVPLGREVLPKSRWKAIKDSHPYYN